MAADILIVDDEADIRELISGVLQDEGYETRLAHNSDAALAEIAQRRPSLIVLDIWLQGSKLDGLDLLSEIKKSHQDVPIVIISGHGNIETAVAAIKRGAYEYIEKPFKADRLLLVIGRAFEATRLKRENEVLKGRVGGEDELIGNSAIIRQLRQSLKKLAVANSRILIEGPMGAGKEVVAHMLHASSARASRPFVTLSAAAMAPDLIEEVLFGVEAGEGQVHRVGALEEAHGGTLYLDEVADMPWETQGKILRVLVEQTFLRLGGAKKVRVDVRIVSSTSRDLPDLVRQLRFREDLYHRLSVVPIRVPALSERREDIPELIDFFSRNYLVANGQSPRKFSEDAIAILQTRNWSGNVRELRNTIERIMIMASAESTGDINASMLPKDIPVSHSDYAFGGEHLLALPLREARETFEREYISAQLARFGSNISRTANFIGMERSALHRKIKLLGSGEKTETDGSQRVEE